MFEFVVGLVASPFITYIVYVYAVIGSRIVKTVFSDNKKSSVQKALSAVLAVVIGLVPMLVVIPLFQHAAMASGLLLGCFFVFLFTRKSSVFDEP